MVGKEEFDQTIHDKKMSATQYIQHLKNIHEMSEQAGIPMGVDALFRKPATYAGKEYSTYNRVPSEPVDESLGDNWFTLEKERGYRMGANR